MRLEGLLALNGARMYASACRHIERLQRGLSFEEFRELLSDMDTLMRSLPPTAQVSRLAE